MRSLICKAMAFFLAITLIIVGADWKILCYAEEEFTEVKINAVVNTIPQQLEVLQDQQGILYLSTDVLSEITVYQYDSETMKFVHDASDGSMNYREVWTFAEEGIQIVNFSRGLINIQKEIALPACPEYNGKRYFPLAELLPVLNANVLVEDGCLYVEDVEYSLTNILATLNIDEYLFDLYDDNDSFWFSDAEILSGWSYLFMTAVRFDWGRMAHIGGFDKFGPISTNTAQIEDYEEIFTSFLSEDTAYLQSVGEENEQYLPLVTYLSSDDYEEEQTRQSALSAVAEYSDRLHEKEIDKYPAMEYYGSQYELISSLDKMSSYVNNAIQLYSYAALYVDHVADHYQMLETVYASEWEHTLFEKLIEKDKSILASKNVYNRFNKNMVTSLSSYVIDQSWDKLLDEAMEYTLFTGPNIAATLIELGLNSYDSSLYETAKECQYLGYYNRLMERGYSRYIDLYHGGAGMSYDTLEDTRLSAIFTLLTSRASYQAMHVAALAMDDGKSLYEDEIAEIDCVLEKLYLAKYCCLTDSEEYIEERVQDLKKQSANLKISNQDSSWFSLESQLEGVDSETLQTYARYFYSHYDEENCSVFLTDLTHDGIKEMTVVSRETGEYQGAKLLYHSDLHVYEIQNNTIYEIYEEFTDSAHIGNKGFSLISVAGKDYIIEYAPWVYQGEATYSASVFNLKGENNEIIELCNSNNLWFVVDEEREDYDPIMAEEETRKFNNFLREYLQNAKTLCNNSGITVSDYNSIADDLFTISAASDIFNGISMEYNDFPGVSINTYEDLLSSYRLNVGIISISNGKVNLRRVPSTDDYVWEGLYSGENNIVQEISNNEEVVLLEKWIPSNLYDYYWDQGSWYLVDYNGMYGYINADYIVPTDKTVSLSNDQLIEIARSRHLEGTWVLTKDFEPLIEIDVESPSIDCYIPVKNLTTKIEVVDVIHTLFSAKYDSELGVNDTMNSMFIEENGVLNIVIADKGTYPYTSSAIVINRIEENEVFFDITLSWARSDMDFLIGKTEEDQFSMVYEDETWKLGHINSCY